jgi:hypothetical protein
VDFALDFMAALDLIAALVVIAGVTPGFQSA